MPPGRQPALPLQQSLSLWQPLSFTGIQLTHMRNVVSSTPEQQELGTNGSGPSPFGTQVTQVSVLPSNTPEQQELPANGLGVFPFGTQLTQLPVLASSLPEQQELGIRRWGLGLSPFATQHVVPEQVPVTGQVAQVPPQQIAFVPQEVPSDTFPVGVQVPL